MKNAYMFGTVRFVFFLRHKTVNGLVFGKVKTSNGRRYFYCNGKVALENKPQFLIETFDFFEILWVYVTFGVDNEYAKKN